jgi:hypothetical protein
MAGDLQTSADLVGGVAQVVDREVRRVLSDAERLLGEALAELRGLDDPAAGQAIALTTSAQDGIRNANYGWLDSYTRRAEELRRRIGE